MGRKLDASLAVLNGVIGDFLEKTGNGLATPMHLFARIGGEPLDLTRSALTRALADASGRVVLLVHGLGSTEGIWEMVLRHRSAAALLSKARPADLSAFIPNT